MDTPYNSLLIFHGVGVGKTCTGVSMAENFKENENKTIILAPEKIQYGWSNTIINPYKGQNQCTGDDYIYDEDEEHVLSDKIHKKYYIGKCYKLWSDFHKIENDDYIYHAISVSPNIFFKYSYTDIINYLNINYNVVTTLKIITKRFIL